MDPVVALESYNLRRPGRSFLFQECVGKVYASTLDEVLPALAEVERQSGQGLHAAGFITYEAATAIDPLLSTHHALLPGSEGPSHSLPLVWFGLFRQRVPINPSRENSSNPPVPLKWSASLTRKDYLDSIQTIQDFLHAGDTYQVNFTYRLWTQLTCDPWLLYQSLCQAQGASYCAYIDTGSHLILSASPELFFEWREGYITTSPMKGTSPRGRHWLEDEHLKDRLAQCVKNRAENVMIVDLMRNDLGRLAEVGSVSVERLFEVERYETVLQMTSTITAKLRPEVTFGQILSALFPCGSVTGAPKINTMRIIRDLEHTPRGLYTGAVGFLSPGQEAVFNVAIRTVVAEKKTRQMEFGVGGGITHSSQPEEEYQESLQKARFLNIQPREFELLESLLYESGPGFFLLQRHLRRLARSAAYFAFPYHQSEVIDALARSIQHLEHGKYKVRLLLNRTGRIQVECLLLSDEKDSLPEPAVIHRAEPVDSTDPFLFNKTTCREVYRSRSVQYPADWHVLLVNEDGELTESATANIVVNLRDSLYTPPVEAGLLPGTYREELLQRGFLKEKPLWPEDLLQAQGVYLINSVRGWIPLIMQEPKKSTT